MKSGEYFCGKRTVGFALAFVALLGLTPAGCAKTPPTSEETKKLESSQTISPTQLAQAAQPATPLSPTKEAEVFPIGVYGSGNVPNGHQLAKEHGFNTLIIPPNEALLKQLSNEGTKVIVKFNLFADTAGDEGKFKAYLDEVATTVGKWRDETAIIAWYVADEPDGLGIPPEKLRAIYERVKAIDTKSRVLAVFNRPLQWKEYLPFVDIVGINPYLRRTSEGFAKRTAEFEPTEVVREWIHQMKCDLTDAPRPRKPLWVMLQAFEYRYEAPDEIPPYKPLSLDDFKAMIEITLTEDAQGLIFYAMGMPAGINKQTGKPYRAWSLPQDRPDLWDYIKTVNERLRKQHETTGGN
jgi:hypothetical protein